MSWRKAAAFLVLPLLACRAVAGEGYILGAGLEGDSQDGFAVSLLGEFGVAKDTWISAAVARNTAESALQQDLDTWFADLGVDRWWNPLGIRAGVAYWGDNDTLDSTDFRGSAYWRNDRLSISGDYQYRDFEIILPATDFFASRKAGFGADGVGLSARVEITDTVSFGLSGMDYDYDVNLKLDSNRPLLQLLTFSRLSLINSLVDYRATATLALDAGKRRWHIDIGTWKGEVDGATTRTATVRFLNPISDASDIEFALGVDDSELYGNVTFFSVFLFFYGAD